MVLESVKREMKHAEDLINNCPKSVENNPATLSKEINRFGAIRIQYDFRPNRLLLNQPQFLHGIDARSCPIFWNNPFWQFELGDHFDERFRLIHTLQMP